MKRHIKRLKYAYVLEVHPEGHGYHVHVALNRFVGFLTIRKHWPHGFIDIRRIKVGTGQVPAQESSRRAAQYLAKYQSKAEDEGRQPGGHRYERSQGGTPVAITVESDSWEALVSWLQSKIRGPIVYRFDSRQAVEWKGLRTLCLWE